MPNTNTPQKPDDATLEQLARRVREAIEAARRERCNALHLDLDIGDALTEAQALVPKGGWKRWLKTSCFLSVRTALLYQRLARHTAQIEAEIERAGELSLRAAVRLISKPKIKAKKHVEKKLDLVTAWRTSTKAERTAALSQIPIDEFYQALPLDWRRSLADRVARLNKTPADGDPFLKASEVLRRALSLLKTASTPEAIANAEHEALAALRRVNALLAGAGIDEITVIKQHAKERRRAA